MFQLTTFIYTRRIYSNINVNNKSFKPSLYEHCIMNVNVINSKGDNNNGVKNSILIEITDEVRNITDWIESKTITLWPLHQIYNFSLSLGCEENYNMLSTITGVQKCDIFRSTLFLYFEDICAYFSRAARISNHSMIYSKKI